MKRHIYLLLLLGCRAESTATPAGSSSGDPPEDASATADAAPAKDAEPAFDGSCVVASFGDKLTAGFGRIDGVITAIQMPNDQTCSMPNRDHLILQVLMNGGVYRMVVNTDVKVLALDYAKDLGAAVDVVRRSERRRQGLGLRDERRWTPGERAPRAPEWQPGEHRRRHRRFPRRGVA